MADGFAGKHRPNGRTLRGRSLAAVLLLVVAACLAVVSPASADVPTAGDFSPSIWSDKADYAPGETVRLAGANWQPGESVHLRVNDDAGSTWSRDVDITADDAGAISETFNLPDWFVATYSVTATGASGAVAATSFTDSNVRPVISPGSYNAQMTMTSFNTTDCSGPADGATQTVTIRGNNQDSGMAVSTGESVRLVAAAFANGSNSDKAFLNWRTLTNLTVDAADPKSACFKGTSSQGLVTPTANYSLTATPTNAAPVIGSTNGSVTVNEGVMATNTGTWSDANAGDTVTLSASRGTVTKSGTSSSGAWSWSLDTTDGPDQSGSVTITANDGTTSTSTTFNLTVNNVAPTVTLSTSNPLSVSEGPTQQTYDYSISDPGADTISSVSTSCGVNGVKVAGSDTNTNTTGSFKCTFPDGPATSVVSASATDSDNAAGNLATQSVTVNNVAPTVTLSGAGTANEGDTKTYSFTVSDPGNDTFSVDAGYPDCDAGSTDNGSFVASSLSLTSSGGSFQCFFADGPATANVKIRVLDSDGAADAASESVQIVAVANVAPTVTAPANQSADEGASKSFALGSFTDPGPDAPWAVDVDWGDGSSHATFNMALTGSLGSLNHTYADGPATRTVSVKVTDKNNGTDTKTFSVQVANVAPKATLSSNNDLTADEGSTHTYSYAISDAGQDTVSSVSTSCGANGTKVANSDTNTDTSGSFKCSFPDGPASSTVSARATDSDGDQGAADTQTVTVSNVAPVVALSSGNDLSAAEGSTHTYNFTISDPGQDTVQSVTTSCGPNGTKVAGSDTNTDTTGAFKCTFPDGPDSSAVSASAKDSDGAQGAADSQTVTVNNVAPTASVTGPATADEGSTKTYNFTVTDAGQDTFTVDAGFPDCDAGASNNGSFVAGSLSLTPSGGSFQCFFGDGPSSANVKVRVLDSDGASDTASESVQVVGVANVAPTMTAPANQSANEGASASLSLGSFSDPGPDSPWAVDVDWGDGSSHATFTSTLTGSLGSLSHTYADGPASRTVSVKVTDKNGGSDTKTFSVAVANVAPKVMLAGGNDLSVNEGSTHTYSYSISDPGDDTVQSVETSCGANGTKVAGSDAGTGNSRSFECSFPDGPKSSTVSARATDSDNDQGAADTQTVAVANVAPTVTLSSANDLSVNEGSTHTYSYDISDPGQDSVVSVATACGAEGTKVAGSDAGTGTSRSFKCTFPDGLATSVVSASATDSDNAAGNLATQSVTIANVAPTVALSGAGSVDEGSTHTYSFTVSDPGNDTFAASAGFPDCDAVSNNGTLVVGSYAPTASGGSFKCSFPDGPSTANVKMKVEDSDGASGTDSESVQVVAVANVAPTVTAAADQGASEGTSKDVNLGSFTDPGPDAPWAVDVDWSDGSAHTTFDASSTGSLGSKPHTYADGPATRTVSVKVTDKNGGTDSKTFSVAVANVAPKVTLSSANHLSVDEGTTHTYSYSISDPGQDTVTSVATSCGANGVKVGSESNTDTSGSFDCRFPDGPNSSTVSASAKDSDGDTGAADTQTVAVANVAPTVALTGDANVDEGSTHTYSFTVSDPGDDGFDPAAGYPDCDAGASNNGTLVAGSYTLAGTGHSGSFKCSFPDGPSQANVAMKVADSDGASGTDSESVQVVAVANAAPTVTAAADQGASEGTSKDVNLGSFTDPGADSPWSVDVDWGDSSAHTTFDVTSAGGLGSKDHTYADGPDSRTVTVKVTDKNGASDIKTFAVSVTNVAPKTTLSATNDLSVNEGTTHTYSYSISDRGQDTVQSVQPDCGGRGTLVTGSSTNDDTSGSFKCSFSDGLSPATATTVSVSAKDSDGDTGAQDTQSVTVNNIAPTVTAAADQTATEGSSQSFTLGTFDDPGTNDSPWKVAVNWGDASSSSPADRTATGSIGSASHSYADNGTYTVSVTVTDKDGGKDTKTFKVAVGNVAPKITEFSGTDYLAGANAFVGGGGVASTFTTRFSDPGSDTWTGAFTYQDGSPLTETKSPFATGQQVKHTFASSGCKSANVKVTDDDGGYDTASTTIKVGTGAFQAPMTNQPVTDKLRNGQVLPVKVHVNDCAGAPATALAPAIRLLSGDLTPQSDDAVVTITPTSVSSADTTGVMRSLGGGDYIYNMQVNVPKLLVDYTVVVYPYGTSSPVELGHVIQATK